VQNLVQQKKTKTKTKKQKTNKQTAAQESTVLLD